MKMYETEANGLINMSDSYIVGRREAAAVLALINSINEKSVFIPIH